MAGLINNIVSSSFFPLLLSFFFSRISSLYFSSSYHFQPSFPTKTSQPLWCPARDQHFNDTNPSALIEQEYQLTLELLVMSSTPPLDLVLFFHVSFTVIIFLSSLSSSSLSYSSTHCHLPLLLHLSSSSSAISSCPLVVVIINFFSSSSSSLSSYSSFLNHLPPVSLSLSNVINSIDIFYFDFASDIRSLLTRGQGQGQGQGKQIILIWTPHETDRLFGWTLK